MGTLCVEKKSPNNKDWKGAENITETQALEVT